MSYKEQIDLNRIPKHVAIIMDGNGRWAKLRGHERSFGHQAGAETVHIITEEAARLGIKFLTLYTFSTENWNRPSDEVAALMSLLFDSIEEETFMKNNISFRIIGRNYFRKHSDTSDNQLYARPGFADPDRRRGSFKQLSALAMCLFGALFL